MGSNVVGERLARGALGAVAAAAVVCSYRRWRVSNLALQKILYIAEVVHLLKFGDAEAPLIGEDFYAWTFGPVLPRLYERVKIFSFFDIQPTEDFNWEMAPATPSDEQLRRCVYLERIAEALASYSAYRLVSQTHVKNGAWVQALGGCVPWEARRQWKVIGKGDILRCEKVAGLYRELSLKPLWS